MATSKDSVQSRNHDLQLIVNQLDELNKESTQRNIWIRTRWNLPNQSSWHLGVSDAPVQGPHNLPVEYPRAEPYLWKWKDIESYLMTLIELCPLELTERQSVLLCNPAYGTKGIKVTNTMRIAISIYKNGDVAEPHEHSPNASRTILSETGGYTVVEGERMTPRRGDLVFTPNGTWHEHGNHDPDPVIWADTLDWPMIDYFNCATARNDFENAADHGNPVEGFSGKFYGHGGLKPRFTPHGRGMGRNVTPMFHYTGKQIRAALDDMRGFNGDPYEGVLIEAVNPFTGGPVFTTMSYRAQLLRPGEETLPYRHTASTIFCVIDGEGYTEVDGKRMEWGKNDFFVVPNHRWRRHANTGKTDAVLYSYSDQPVLSALGFYRAQGKSKGGTVVDLE